MSNTAQVEPKSERVYAPASVATASRVNSHSPALFVPDPVLHVPSPDSIVV